MNPKSLWKASLVCLALVPCAFADDAKTAAAPAPSAAAAPAPAFTEAQMLEEFGWYLIQKTGVTQMDLTQPEADAMVKGIQAALYKKESPYELQKIGPVMSDLIQKKQMVLLDRIRMKNLSDDAAFFTKLKGERKNLVETHTGLRYEIIVQGAGEPPKPADTIKVNYTGTLIDGTVFDSSERTGKPAELQLNQTIPGWIEGLQKIGKGGKMKLYIPPQLAYGDEGRPGIPPAAALVFDVELVDITPGAAASTPAITLPAGVK